MPEQLYRRLLVCWKLPIIFISGRIKPRAEEKRRPDPLSKAPQSPEIRIQRQNPALCAMRPGHRKLGQAGVCFPTQHSLESERRKMTSPPAPSFRTSGLASPQIMLHSPRAISFLSVGQKTVASHTIKFNFSNLVSAASEKGGKFSVWGRPFFTGFCFGRQRHPLDFLRK